MHSPRGEIGIEGKVGTCRRIVPMVESGFSRYEIPEITCALEHRPMQLSVSPARILTNGISTEMESGMVAKEVVFTSFRADFVY
jgi:hypothetical protein